MKLDFDFTKVKSVEFGAGVGPRTSFVAIAVDNDVQDALEDMAKTTWAQMQALSNRPDAYQPAEKYAAIEYVYYPSPSLPRTG
jgi:hypothetical protein